MTGKTEAGRAWSDDIARRPGGYSVTWTQWVEGPDAQAIFDALVFDRTAGKIALDCGCGDGAFTLAVARGASSVTGIDFSEGMLAHARVLAAERGMQNVVFVHAHARQDALLPARSFDVAYSRRGPNITAVVPALVRPGGVLLGLHPLERDEDQVRYAQGLRESDLDVRRFERLDDRLRFPTLVDLAGYLQRTPGMPDVRRPEHADLLHELAGEMVHPDGGFVQQVRWLLWEAQVRW
ncbi:class I SAM-dependent methyltransferase [Deinococcus peraridilitoris]|uniref:Methylase involved in ubiquinone/menaquinone biosynthesis n=1 Tax=Deinococcus peraridilitoris (strain DSM 19664 / LMG 22246 / CIP 109416 / KR-200) TaxID=937777 RepID=L0A3P2_DEIPD|nr:methyltransferase domain-containing protein [Deinococcus peraridilitoris]AFZ68054.1 methylase involved in ubiquinone/menaquinone biosynthesis [Deinococcus peraridilitoris DSM 19664]